MTARTNMLTIRTPEGVVFSMRLAGPVTRFLAWGIDILIILFLSRVAGILAMVFGFISLDIANAVFVLVSFVASIGYGIVAEWFWRGQTFGKRMLRLRVMDVEGRRLQFSQIVIRNLLRAVDSLPIGYVVGGVACLINRHSQRLGDLAANTVVIRSPKVEAPDVDQLLVGKFNSLQNHPHLEARLRQRVTPLEADVAFRCLLRREQLDPTARARLFKELADDFKSLVPFPPEASDGITDEQYVRNVVDSLFRKRAGRSGESQPDSTKPEPTTQESVSA